MKIENFSSLTKSLCSDLVHRDSSTQNQSSSSVFNELSIFSRYRLLNTLKICNWIIHLDDATKTFKAISKALKSSTISHLKIDGISVLDRAKKHRVEPQFLQALLSSVPMLRWISVSLSGVSEEQMSFIGNSIGDIKSNEIDIRFEHKALIDNFSIFNLFVSNLFFNQIKRIHNRERSSHDPIAESGRQVRHPSINFWHVIKHSGARREDWS